MRVSFFVHDLAGNPIVRAAPLARALQRSAEVELLGFLLSGGDVFAPYRDLFPYKTVTCSLDVGSVLRNMGRLAALATGDVIYACKPLLTSLGPALWASGFGRDRPLLLDVEDDEWVPMGKGWRDFLWRDVLKGWRHATAWKYTMSLHPLTRCAAGVTVVSRKLQRRYGGVLVRHGPDEHLVGPAETARQDCGPARKRFNLPTERRLALFAGVPQPHKGWDTLLEALELPPAIDWDLVLAGPSDHYEFLRAAERLSIRCHLLGPVPQARMPDLLAAVDAVPAPQRQVVFAESQVPAKVLEAMALGVPVVASRVGDLPEILGEGERGWLFPPDDAAGLAQALAHVADDRTAVRRRTAAARDWFLQHASSGAIHAALSDLIHKTVARRGDAVTGR